ncbi:MAG: hypothetical protein H6622_07990 [Halobacteriovoraceae bacterium]|nr:hypothetical protein [Halobacteriovoraceae bacterium]
MELTTKIKSSTKKFDFKIDTKRMLISGILMGIGCFVWGYLDSPERAWINYLINMNYFISLALGGTVIVGISAVTKASWTTPFKRIPESLSSFLPAGLVLFLGLFFGVHTIYEWSHSNIVANDPILLGKSSYLNIPWFMIRGGVFLILWIALSKRLVGLSRKQDKAIDDSLSGKMTFWSVIFLIFFGLSYSFASFDWLMSLKPHWFSTIFAVYNFSGLFVNALCVVTLMLIWLQKKGYFQDVNENHYHDLGKLIFGFSTFWAYIWLSQYLLIWYSNIPEETIYFDARVHHTWDWLFYFNLGVNWVIPFFALMPRSSKRNNFILYRICILLIVGRWLDLYLMAAPDVYHHAKIANPQIGLIEIGIALGFASLFIFIIGSTVTKNNLTADNDPYLEEGRNLHQ